MNAETELRSALAARLFSLAAERDPFTGRWHGLMDARVWDDWVEEIIRQMAYTRYQDALTANTMNEALLRMPLEFAPPNWEP